MVFIKSYYFLFCRKKSQVWSVWKHLLLPPNMPARLQRYMDGLTHQYKQSFYYTLWNECAITSSAITLEPKSYKKKKKKLLFEDQTTESYRRYIIGK